MATPTSPLSLLPPKTSYQYYFSRANTDTFRRRYAAVLAPYVINPVTAVANAAPVDFAQLIYAAGQEGVMNAFV